MSEINETKYFVIENNKIKKIKDLSIKTSKESNNYDKDVFNTAKEILNEALPFMDGIDGTKKDGKISVEEMSLTFKNVGSDSYFKKKLKEALLPKGLDFIKSTDFAYDEKGNAIGYEGDGIIDAKDLAMTLKWLDEDQDGKLGSSYCLGTKFLFTSKDEYREELKKLHKLSDT